MFTGKRLLKMLAWFGMVSLTRWTWHFKTIIMFWLFICNWVCGPDLGWAMRRKEIGVVQILILRIGGAAWTRHFGTRLGLNNQTAHRQSFLLTWNARLKALNNFELGAFSCSPGGPEWSARGFRRWRCRRALECRNVSWWNLIRNNRLLLKLRA